MTTRHSRGPVSRGQLTREIQFWLRELTARLHQLNDAVAAQIDLRAVDVEVMDLVARHGPLSPGELASTTGIHPATLTGIIDRLEAGGWVIRAPDPVDRRRILLEAQWSRGGEITRLFGPMNRSLAALCGDLTPGQLGVVRDFLRGAAGAGTDAAARAREADR
jgi:DNA-binding MarR family transcriptional regulator